MKRAYNFLFVLILFCVCGSLTTAQVCTRRSRTQKNALPIEAIRKADPYAADAERKKRGWNDLSISQLNQKYDSEDMSKGDYKELLAKNVEDRNSAIDKGIIIANSKKNKAQAFLYTKIAGLTPRERLKKKKDLAKLGLWSTVGSVFLQGHAGKDLEKMVTYHQGLPQEIKELETQIEENENELREQEARRDELRAEKLRLNRAVKKVNEGSDTYLKNEIKLNRIPTSEETALTVSLNYDLDIRVAKNDLDAAAKETRNLERQLENLKKRKSKLNDPVKTQYYSRENIEAMAIEEAKQELQDAQNEVRKLESVPSDNADNLLQNLAEKAKYDSAELAKHLDWSDRPSLSELQKAQKDNERYNPSNEDYEKFAKRRKDKFNQVQEDRKKELAAQKNDLIEKSMTPSDLESVQASDDSIRQITANLVDVHEIIGQDKLTIDDLDRESGKGFWNENREQIIGEMNGESLSEHYQTKPTALELRMARERLREIYGREWKKMQTEKNLLETLGETELFQNRYNTEFEKSLNDLRDVIGLLLDEAQNPIDQRVSRDDIFATLSPTFLKAAKTAMEDGRKIIFEMEPTLDFYGRPLENTEENRQAVKAQASEEIARQESNIKIFEAVRESAKDNIKNLRREAIPTASKSGRLLKQIREEMSNIDRFLESDGADRALELERQRSQAKLDTLVDIRNGESYMKRHGISGEEQKTVVREYLKYDNMVKAAEKHLSELDKSNPAIDAAERILKLAKEERRNFDFENKLADAAHKDARQRATDGVVKRKKGMSDRKYARAIAKERGIDVDAQIWGKFQENTKFLETESQTLKHKIAEAKDLKKKNNRVGLNAEDKERLKKLPSEIRDLKKEIIIRKAQDKIFTRQLGNGYFVSGLLTGAKNVLARTGNKIRRFFGKKEIPNNDIIGKVYEQIIELEQGREEFELAQAKKDYDERKAQIDQDSSEKTMDGTLKKQFEHKTKTEFNLGREAVNQRHFTKQMRDSVKFKLSAEIRRQTEGELIRQREKSRANSLATRFSSDKKSIGYIDKIRVEVETERKKDETAVDNLKILMKQPPETQYDGSNDDWEFLNKGDPTNDRLQTLLERKKSEKKEMNNDVKLTEAKDKVTAANNKIRKFGGNDFTGTDYDKPHKRAGVTDSVREINEKANDDVATKKKTRDDLKDERDKILKEINVNNLILAKADLLQRQTTMNTAEYITYTLKQKNEVQESLKRVQSKLDNPDINPDGRTEVIDGLGEQLAKNKEKIKKVNEAMQQIKADRVDQLNNKEPQVTQESDTVDPEETNLKKQIEVSKQNENVKRAIYDGLMVHAEKIIPNELYMDSLQREIDTLNEEKEKRNEKYRAEHGDWAQADAKLLKSNADTEAKIRELNQKKLQYSRNPTLDELQQKADEEFKKIWDDPNYEIIYAIRDANGNERDINIKDNNLQGQNLDTAEGKKYFMTRLVKGRSIKIFKKDESRGATTLERVEVNAITNLIKKQQDLNIIVGKNKISIPGRSTTQLDAEIKLCERRNKIYAEIKRNPGLVLELYDKKHIKSDLLWQNKWVDKKPRPTFDGAPLDKTTIEQIRQMAVKIYGGHQGDVKTVVENHISQISEPSNNDQLKDARSEKEAIAKAEKKEIESIRDKGYLDALRKVAATGTKKSAEILVKSMPGAREALLRHAATMKPEENGLDALVERKSEDQAIERKTSPSDDALDYLVEKSKEDEVRKKIEEASELKRLHANLGEFQTLQGEAQKAMKTFLKRNKKRHEARDVENAINLYIKSELDFRRDMQISQDQPLVGGELRSVSDLGEKQKELKCKNQEELRGKVDKLAEKLDVSIENLNAQAKRDQAQRELTNAEKELADEKKRNYDNLVEKNLIDEETGKLRVDASTEEGRKQLLEEQRQVEREFKENHAGASYLDALPRAKKAKLLLNNLYANIQAYSNIDYDYEADDNFGGNFIDNTEAAFEKNLADRKKIIEELLEKKVITPQQANDFQSEFAAGSEVALLEQQQQEIVDEVKAVRESEKHIGELMQAGGDKKKLFSYEKGLDNENDLKRKIKEKTNDLNRLRTLTQDDELKKRVDELKAQQEKIKKAEQKIRDNNRQAMTERQRQSNVQTVFGGDAQKAAEKIFGLKSGTAADMGYDDRMRDRYAKWEKRNAKKKKQVEMTPKEKRMKAVREQAKERMRSKFLLQRALKKQNQESTKLGGYKNRMKKGMGAVGNFIKGKGFAKKTRITVSFKSRSGLVSPIEYSNGLSEILSGENPCQTTHTEINQDQVCVVVPLHLRVAATDRVEMGFKVVTCPTGTVRFPAKYVFHFEDYFHDHTEHTEWKTSRWNTIHVPHVQELFCRGCNCLLGKGLRREDALAGIDMSDLAGRRRRLYATVSHNGSNVTISGTLDSVKPGEFLRRMEFVVRSDSCQYEIAKCENETFSTNSTFVQTGYFSCSLKTCPDNTYIANINVTDKAPDCVKCPIGTYSNNPLNTSCVDQIQCGHDEKFEDNGAEGSCTFCDAGFVQNRPKHRETTCYETFSCGPGEQIRLNGTTFDPQLFPDTKSYHSLLQDASECFDSKQNCDFKDTQQETCLSMCTFGDFESCNLNETDYSLHDSLNTTCKHYANSLSCKKYHEGKYETDYDSSTESDNINQFCVDDGTEARMLIQASVGDNYVCQGAEISEDSDCRACYIACRDAREDTIIPRDHTLTCEACPDGTYKVTPGRERCTAHPSCPAGTYANFTTVNQECVACPEGTHQPNSNVNASCIPCEWNLTSADLACACENSEDYAVDESFCPVLSCLAGQYLSIDENVTVCAACDGNTYMNATNHTYTECFPMKTCLLGQQWIRPINPIRDAECSLCPEGQFQSTDNHSSACEVWTVCPGENLYIQRGSEFNDALCDNTTCACNNGVGAECEDPETQNCTSCNAGYYLSLTGGCDPCDIQEWSNGSAVQISETETGCFAKSECPEFRYDASDDRQDSNCQPCNPCEPGNYAIENCANNVDTLCSECPAGQYQDSYNYTCSLCPVGQVQADTGATSCDNCTVGSYQNELGQVVCKDCNSGTYQATPGSVECDDCEFGKYTDVALSIDCVECSVGMYSTSAGAVRCITCNPSEYQDETGKTLCKQCPSSDTYEATSAPDRDTCLEHCQVGYHGPSICTACSENTYQSVSGYNGSECTACPEGSVSDPSSATCTKCKAGYGNTGSTDTYGNVICEVCSNSNDQPEFNEAQDGSACGQVAPCGPGFGYYPTPLVGLNTNGTDECSPCDVDMYSETTDFQPCHAQDICLTEYGQDILYEGNSTKKRICTALDFCHGTEYAKERMSVPPYTPTCESMSICYAGEYEFEAPVGRSDRWISNRICSACPAGTYSSYINQPTCAAWYVCGPDEYETTPPTNISDRVCTPLTNCSVNEYESTPPTNISDRVCDTLSTCAPGTHIDNTNLEGVDNRNADRVCSPCTDGYTDMTNWYICLPWRSVCDYANEYESKALNASNNRECTPFTVCEDDEYESQAKTNTRNRICTPLTQCVPGTHVTKLPNATSDRECSACTDAYTDQSDQLSCSPWTTCGNQLAGGSRLTNHTASFKGTCAPCVNETWAESGTEDCQSWTSGCFANADGSARRVNHSATSPGVCGGDCASGWAVSTTENCQPWTECIIGKTFQVISPTATRDRACQNVTECDQSTQFQTSAPSYYADRTCQTLTTCSPTQYELYSPNATTDRVCHDLSTCLNGEYISVAATTVSDLECELATECIPGEAETGLYVGAPIFKNRECTKCAAGKFQNLQTMRCEACPTGTFQNLTGSTSCHNCPAGFYAGSIHSNAECTHCPNGRWSNGQHSSSFIYVNRGFGSDRCQPWDHHLWGSDASQPCGKNSDGTDRRIGASATSPGACGGDCTVGWTVLELGHANYGNDDCRAWTDCQLCGTPYNTNCGTPWHVEVGPPTPWSDRVCEYDGPCQTWSDTYEAVPPMNYSTRVCAPLTECQKGTYITKEPQIGPYNQQYISNRECTACPAGKFSDNNDEIGNGDPCKPLTECHPNEYQTRADDPTRDRSCANIRSCSLGYTYEAEAPTNVSDRVCADVRTCHTGTYVSAGSTLTTDRNCTICPTGKYTDGHNKGSCSDWETCGTHLDGSTRLTGATHKLPGTCEPCKSGWSSSKWDCQPWTACHPNEYQTQADDPTRDRTCGQCSASQFLSTTTSYHACATCPNNSHSGITNAQTCTMCKKGYGNTGTTDAEGHVVCEMCLNANYKWNDEIDESACGDVQKCGPGYGYNAHPSSEPSTTDSDCFPCGTGMYSNTTDYSVCKPWSTCKLGETYESQAPSAEKDRVCSPVSSSCPDGMVIIAATLLQDRECAAARNCTLGETYETRAPTLLQDRECGAVRNCTLGETYETRAPTLLQDRECGAARNCTLGETYETRAPTLLQDRECAAVTPVLLCPDGFYEYAPTLLQDRECGAVRNCTLGETYETQAPTLELNRECAAVRKCTLGETYETRAPTLLQDRECAAVTSCGAKIELDAPTLLADKTCKTCSELSSIYAADCSTMCSNRCSKIKQVYNTNCQTCSL